MTVLILTLPATPIDACATFDYVASLGGLSVSDHGTVAMEQLSQLPLQTPTLQPLMRTATVVVVLPTLALSWHQVTLPRGSLPRGLMSERSSTRLRTILASLLEDQLLDDPDQLHLALQPQPREDAPTWVAVCNHAWLVAGLQAITQAGYNVSRVVPEFCPDAADPGFYVLGTPCNALLLGRVLPSDCFLAMPLSVDALALHSEPSTLNDLRPITAEPSVAALAESLFKRPVQLLQGPQRLLQAIECPWDMAQFDLRHAERDRRRAGLVKALNTLWRGPQWRAARLALVAILLVQLAGLNTWSWREQASLAAKRLAVRNVLTGTFPTVPVVVDAPVQMKHELAALQRAKGAPQPSDLDVMLATLSATVPVGYALTAIDYAAQELRFKGPTLTADDQSRLALALKQQGLSLTRQGLQWSVKPSNLANAINSATVLTP